MIPAIARGRRPNPLGSRREHFRPPEGACAVSLAVRAVFVAALGSLALSVGSGTAAYSESPHQSPPEPRPPVSPPANQRAVLAKYCQTCHNQRLRTGGLALDTANLD